MQIQTELSAGEPELPGGWSPFWVPKFEYPVKVEKNEYLDGHNIPDLQVGIAGGALSAPFLTHFNRTGGLRRWGRPISEVVVEQWSTLTQFYENGVVDFRPSSDGWVIQRRLLGDQLAGKRKLDLGAEIDQEFRRYFEEVGGVESMGLPTTAATLEGGLLQQNFQAAILVADDGVRQEPLGTALRDQLFSRWQSHEGMRNAEPLSGGELFEPHRISLVGR